MADISDKLILFAIMLLLIATGVFAMFNLGENITPALSTAFKGGSINIIWTILLRLIIAPLMIIVPIYVMWKVITEM